MAETKESTTLRRKIAGSSPVISSAKTNAQKHSKNN